MTIQAAAFFTRSCAQVRYGEKAWSSFTEFARAQAPTFQDHMVKKHVFVGESFIP